MAQLAIVDAYQQFMATAHPFINIDSDEQYEAALETLEQIMETAADTPDDSMNPLIDMISHAIEQYEAKDDELTAFIEEAEAIPADIALLRTLMSQYNLTGSDLPEIGDKTMVSKVLNGKRVLSRQAIEKLSARFGLRPAMFFER
ncbi:helix-turn-helix domain-containing protein [Aliamphritea spongicola]|uniref:helix-turn-helix domain-containing protein n=1 Tax=Aliamphritea spongicola TaxID=707589 RepID=UPI00196A5364|nr:transcriptional regulator [Aliamphritea spongicola]MBN3563918.1 transcriptional regulator [Aliamphritea spongicola]